MYENTFKNDLRDLYLLQSTAPRVEEVPYIRGIARGNKHQSFYSLRQSQKRCLQLLEIWRAQSTDRVPAWRSRKAVRVTSRIAAVRHVVKRT
jgi:hypothetical protein